MFYKFVKKCIHVFYCRFVHGGIKNDFHRKAVFITGCDSGLGYNFAVHLHSKGVQVFAGVYNESSPGAKSLLNQNISILNVDIRDSASIQQASMKIKETLSENNYDFFGLINNAGIMVVGEFEWLSEEMIEQQITVNLLGPMRVIKYFLPILRCKEGRVVNISSHCAGFPLPGMSVYSASKAGLRGFTLSLSRELQKFGIRVVEVVPGSFIMHSCIMSKQREYSTSMSETMSADVKKLYKDYFNRYMNYLSTLPVPDPTSSPQIIDDPSLYSKLEAAMFSSSPRNIYINEPPKYFLYYTLFSFLPECSLKDYVIKKFIQMPEWDKNFYQ